MNEKEEKIGREWADDTASLQIVGDWMEYLNEFDWENEDEDPQME